MKVHHIGYLVKDITKAYPKFQCLGYIKECETIVDEHRGIRIMFIINENERIELIEPVGNNSVVAELYKKYKNCAYHICYVTNNLESDTKMLIANGATQIDEPHAAIALNNKNVVFFIIPSIGMIELLEE